MDRADLVETKPHHLTLGKVEGRQAMPEGTNDGAYTGLLDNDAPFVPRLGDGHKVPGQMRA
ncbi:MAG: hypothetical protein E5X19_01880 [Mesorhizobium sp.]|nr:MAG: hypothetical protein E5X19_01880 [Mesorhizobium sp.]